VVNATPRPFYPREKPDPLYWRLGGPHGRFGWIRKISTPLGFDPRTVQSIASRYVVQNTIIPTFTTRTLTA
jgi:hypothetical protein